MMNKEAKKNYVEEMKKNFCITHFFNPVRYMGLLEIVIEPINDKEKINLRMRMDTGAIEPLNERSVNRTQKSVFHYVG